MHPWPQLLLIAGRKRCGGGAKVGAPSPPRQRRLLLLLTAPRGAAGGCHIRAELRHAPNARTGPREWEEDLPGGLPPRLLALRAVRRGDLVVGYLRKP